VAELRKLEQGGRTMEEFMQEFKKAARGSGYEGRPLVEEFKRGINRGIRRKLMEAESQLASIEQWYKRATALNRNWRESRKEKERLRGKKEIRGGMQKQEQRMNMVVVRGVEQGQGQGAEVPPRWDPYAMEVDRGRNCYACGGFGHMLVIAGIGEEEEQWKEEE